MDTGDGWIHNSHGLDHCIDPLRGTGGIWACPAFGGGCGADGSKWGVGVGI